MERCVNIDWLEVHVLEDMNQYPLDAYFFKHDGWRVEQREYGTRIYNQMFTIYDTNDEPFIEVRRAPKSAENGGGILAMNSAHIRLTNRYCYFSNCVQLLRDFLSRYHYEFKRIFRIDLCLDFERFDLGDDPQKFIVRYLRHKFAKINQSERTARGKDRWDGCEDNYVSWGSHKSMVGTKLYNKSKELQEVHMKPYIVQAWMASGLVTNPLTMVKVRKDGTQYTPTIWRVEFSVKSGAAGWAILEDCTGAKNKLKPIANTLECYDTKEKQLQMFASLAYHYFHFKYYEPNTRKDRCRDKILFHFDFAHDTIYKLQHIASSTPPADDDMKLEKLLRKWAEKHFEPDVSKACHIILAMLERDIIRPLSSNRWDSEQVTQLQMVLRRRMEQPEEEFQVTWEKVRRLIQATAEGVIF